VLAGVTDDRDDWRFELLQDNLRVLRAVTDARGRRLRVETLPMPAVTAITEEEAAGVVGAQGSVPRRAGDELAASYVNFLVVNGGAVMPAFGDPYDASATARLEEVFPDRRVVTVPGREIALGGGNVHCMTQQQPAACVGPGG
jgi:agmatine deiminase